MVKYFLIILILFTFTHCEILLIESANTVLANHETTDSTMPDANTTKIADWDSTPFAQCQPQILLDIVSKNTIEGEANIKSAAGNFLRSQSDPSFTPPKENTPLPPIQITYKEHIKNQSKRRMLQTDDESSTFRELVFNQQLKVINEHNANSERTYNMGINQFTDYTEQEIKDLYSGFKLEQRQERRRLLTPSSDSSPMNENINSVTQPENWIIDWRCIEKFPVYQMGNCGASSFFSTIDALQITLKIWGVNNFKDFSMQAPLSCFSQNPKNVCVDGTNFIFIYDYVRKYGIGPALAYPYTDATNVIDASPCNYQKLRSLEYKKSLFSIKEIYLVQENDCREVVNQLTSRALTVAIIANPNFTKYQSGTFSYDPQAKETVNLSVVLVGYHPEKGYLIKNAWGKAWGMQGYAYVAKESGICTWAVFAKGFYRMSP